MWSMLGARPVDMLAWESFGQGWATDATKQLRSADARVLTAAYGALPDLAARQPRRRRLLHLERHDLRRPRPRRRLDRRRPRRPHLLRRHLRRLRPGPRPGPKLDVTTFSWQKAMGGEGGHGVLILSPRAVERLESFTPTAPAAEDLPPDQGRQADRGHLRRRDDQHPLDALRRRRRRRARLDGADRRPRRDPRPRRRELRGAAGLGRPDRLGREPRRRPRGALEHLGLPEASSTRRSPASTRRRSATSSSG